MLEILAEDFCEAGAPEAVSLILFAGCDLGFPVICKNRFG
jgi:hypothetical protein